MTDNPTPIATLIERAEEYGKTTIELIKLNAIDKSADVVSSLISRVAVFVAVVLSVMILSIGLALFIGNLLNEVYYGFLIVGGLGLFIALLMHIFRREWLKYPVSNSIIKQMLKEKVS